MLTANVCRFRAALCTGIQLTNKVATLLVSKPNVSLNSNIALRQASIRPKTVFSPRAAAAGSKTWKKVVRAPVGKQVGFGKVVAFGVSSALGLGAIAFYGLRFSPGANESSMMWPDDVKQHIHDTYMYFGGSLALSAASAVACSRNPTIMRVAKSNSWLALIGATVAIIATGRYVRRLPYKKGAGAKQAAWAFHSVVIGALLAPLCCIGGPLLLRAVVCTAGVVGGLSAVAVCAPNDEYLRIAGPLGIGLGLVCATSLGSLYLPQSPALCGGLHLVSLYAGLALFSALFFFYTQKIVNEAKTLSPNAAVPYDPVNASLSIYLDTICIFNQITRIVRGDGSKKSGS